jgi:hypothetical protein
MKSVPLALLALTLAACTAHVSHPTKTMAEQQADVDLCTKAANHKYWMDPIAALLNAYDCLEAKGYRKEKSGLKEQVERSAGHDRERRRERGEPQKPCSIPCRK